MIWKDEKNAENEITKILEQYGHILNKVIIGYKNKYVCEMHITAKCYNYDLINSQYVRDNSIFLPLYETLSLDDVDKISKTFAYVINNYCKDIEIFDERGYDEEINYFDGFYLMRKK